MSKVISVPLIQPSPGDVRAARAAVGLTQIESAELVGMTVNMKSKPPQSRGWQDAENDRIGKLQPATWLLYQLLTDQHAGFKVVMRVPSAKKDVD